MLPYKVLAEYRIKTWDAEKIGYDLCKITWEAGLAPHIDPLHGPLDGAAWYSIPLHAEVRNYTFSTKQAEDWHQDGDTTPGAKMDCALVTWATSKPTEFEYKGQIYQAKPFEVVAVRNLVVKHRRPKDCAKYRWLFRQRVAVPEFLK